jgi:Holliday junction resolvase RusA-like endonuclease
MTPKARQSHKAMTAYLNNYMHFFYGLDEFPIKEEMLMRVEFTFPNNRRRDVSNRIKSLEDCLVKAGVIADDSLINTKLDGKTVIKGETSTSVSLWRIN